MMETGVGHLGLSGFGVFAIVVGWLSLTVLAAILVRRRKSPLPFVIKRSTAKRAIPFVVMTWLLVAAGCAATTPTVSLTGGPPQIPHSLEGREGRCLLCHEAGVAGAPRVPANHAGRTSDICQLCHMRAAAPAASQGTSATYLPPGRPPQIPHSLEGREGLCLVCHEAGVAGAPRVPANHAGGTSDVCQLCHIRAAAPAASQGVSANPTRPAATSTAAPATPTVAPATPTSVSATPTRPEATSTPAPATPTPAPPPTAGDATAGKALFASKGCSACHGPEAQGGIGPNLKTPKREASLITTIMRSGKGAMPAYTQAQVSDAELQNIIAFLQAP